MANDIIPLAFETDTLRAVMVGGEPWFVATDAAKILGYRNAPDATRNLDDDEKGTHNLRTLGGGQSLTIISEAGVFQLIFRSRKPEAHRFRRWLAHEVLPALRRTGSYTVPGPATVQTAPAVLPDNLSALTAMVAECRHVHGKAAARRLWVELALPGSEWLRGGLEPPDGESFAALGRRALDALMAAPAPGGGRFADRVTAAVAGSARVDLASIGLRVTPDRFQPEMLVSGTHPAIQSAFDGTDFADDWRRALAGVPAARRHVVAKFAGRSARCTALPLSEVDLSIARIEGGRA